MIGIDIENIDRIENLFTKKRSLLKRMFNEYEWNYSLTKSKPSQTLTGIWCAKEAVLKALSPFTAIFIKDIIIKHKPSGEPYVVFDNKIINYKTIYISISHSKDYATAVAVVE